jgi:hypothetical protein
LQRDLKENRINNIFAFFVAKESSTDVRFTLYLAKDFEKNR